VIDYCSNDASAKAKVINLGLSCLHMAKQHINQLAGVIAGTSIKMAVCFVFLKYVYFSL